MLRAIIHSKSRSVAIPKDQYNNLTDLNVYINFRDCYQDIEDFFTASVFGRICYLSGSEIESLLRDATKADLSVFGELKEREFWPNWKYEIGARQRIEPDVFLRFEHCDVIVEAKRYDLATGQSINQIKLELDAYYKTYRNDEKPVYLLAIGGIRPGLQDELAQINSGKVFAIRWDDIYKALTVMKLNCFIKEDLIAAFELHGYRQLSWLRDLCTNEVSIDMTKIESLSRTFVQPPQTWVMNLSKLTDLCNYHRTLEALKWK
jgi:hypothetical protein